MSDRLERYRRKRDPERTPEPFGPAEEDDAAALAPRPFVVQKHAARRLHWDFRLELGGTLRSWAVPKGPSYDPADRRMAVEVEDHPIEYADFEGIIPPGNYGAGRVIVWDRGAWRPRSDPERGLAQGKLVFELEGYKLRGEWTLVRTRRSEGGKQDWLLLKHRDALAGPGRHVPEESVLSGRLLEEVADADPRGSAALAAARGAGARKRRGAAGGRAMLAAAAREIPRDPGWLFEVAYGGYRALARRDGARVALRYRAGAEAGAIFPEVTKALRMLPADALLDGELVVLGPDGRPSAEALEARGRLAGPDEVRRASFERPATFFAFDLLEVGGLDLRPLPLVERKRILAGLVPRLGPLRWAEHVEGHGDELLAEVEARGLGGVVAKRADAPYRAGRSPAWRAIGARGPGRAGPRPEPPPAPAPAPAREAEARRVEVTNREKVFFPGEGITKGEVVDYYREIAPFMLPYLAERPIVVTRHPDGIEGKSFFQKDAPDWRPAWIRTARVRSDEGRDLDHFLVDDADGLAWIANLGVITVHVPASRAGALERPDWCVLDLDPKGAPFAHVVRIARAIHDLCRAVGLPCHPKTTGQSGLHLLVPLGGQLTHAQSRALGELLARAVERELPDLATTARAVAARGGRVYLDFMQNGAGKTIAAPYAVRPRPGAPVSTPLRWAEVGPALDPASFTIRTVPARARRLRSDPLLPVLRERPDLLAALARLRARLAGGGAGADRPGRR